jgi:hypothetical protein
MVRIHSNTNKSARAVPAALIDIVRLLARQAAGKPPAYVSGAYHGRARLCCG